MESPQERSPRLPLHLEVARVDERPRPLPAPRSASPAADAPPSVFTWRVGPPRAVRRGASRRAADRGISYTLAGLIVAFLLLAVGVAILGSRAEGLERGLRQSQASLAQAMAELGRIRTTQEALATPLTGLGAAGLVATAALEVAAHDGGAFASARVLVENRGLAPVQVLAVRVRIYTAEREPGDDGALAQLNLPLEEGPLDWRERGETRAPAGSSALGALPASERAEQSFLFALPDDATLVGAVIEVSHLDDGEERVRRFVRLAPR